MVFTFPRLPLRQKIVAGQSVSIRLPSDQINALAPPRSTEHGQPMFTVALKYQVDGGPVQSLPLMKPRATGSGGYQGIELTEAKLTAPVGARHLQFWFEGSRRTDFSQADQSVKFFSNFGANFQLDVVNDQLTPLGAEPPGSPKRDDFAF